MHHSDWRGSLVHMIIISRSSSLCIWTIWLKILTSWYILGLTRPFIRATNAPWDQVLWHNRRLREGCETPGKGPRLEEERGERSHLHLEGRDALNQPGWGAPPSSRSLLAAVVPWDLVSWHIRSSDEGSSQSRNISAGKNFLPNSLYTQWITSRYASFWLHTDILY